MIAHEIEIDEARIAEFCRRNRIRRLSPFGSILRDDFGPESDVDVLVEFEPGQTPGLAFFGLQDDLAGIIGRRVDLNTANCLSKYFREAVITEARPVYVRAR